jgi:signal transduction histidine kinase
MVPEAIQQVLVILIVNALDAMESQANPALTIRTSATQNLPRYAVIQITDNGTGIPDEAMSRLFDPFFTTKPVGKGTGLGLSIAYNFIREHHGHITVRSTPGNGATFCVHLPLTDALKTSPPKTSQPEAAPESAQI